MDFAIAVLLRPFLYLILWVLVIYWVSRLIWKMLPPGNVRDLLFRRW